MLDMPQERIDERRRLGLDRKDEVWDGVLHMVPPASSMHNEFGSHLHAVLYRLAMDKGLRCFVEPGLFDPEVTDLSSYRVPDLGAARSEHVSERGIEGRATLAVEVLSPGDESYEKLAFYRRVGVEELLYVDPRTRAFEARTPTAEGWAVTGPDGDGWVALTSADAAVRTLAVSLHIRTPSGTHTI